MKHQLVPITLLALASVLGLSTDADASRYKNLCDSIEGACEHTGPDAPRLAADVCWNGKQATIKWGSCPWMSWSYHVEYGEVLDSRTGEVQGYIPLDWACDHSGICVAGPVPPQATLEPICCHDGACFPLTAAGCPVGSVKYMCKSGVSNMDGTVTCFEGTPVPDP